MIPIAMQGKPSKLHIVLVHSAIIPVTTYGGTERVVWDLGRELVRLGHKVTYLAPQGSYCPFADLQYLRAGTPWSEQLPLSADVVHFQFNPSMPETIHKPWLMTQHGNSPVGKAMPLNTVFVSRNHAQRHGAECYVYNGLNWDAYGKPNISAARAGLHFLAKAQWRVKNVVGAIAVAKHAKRHLDVLGGYRFNLKRGLRLTFSRQVSFHGMVGGEQKLSFLRYSSGLVLPVRWHEPFGLALIESMYFGSPVFATPYGALPEIVLPENGVLHTNARHLAEAITTHEAQPWRNHQRVIDCFSATQMTYGYLRVYEKLMNGYPLNAIQPVMREKADDLPWTNN
jgi:glycosyltransferase involved in cell wall biosynthesis